ncbi:MAG: hypothetical protein CV087_13450 [Candidatus Brocadia sp. WS118]|nr:MAG: hypothetical protein CV087_13450 [Candidatus Brocadia sp. WS118]
MEMKDMRSKNMFVICLFALMLFGFNSLTHSADETTGLPAAYLISDVPCHKQITALSCGPAALEILYDFWGEDIDQKAIADVARSSTVGTYTWDMVRAAYFSHLSSAQGRFFPKNVPRDGYPERPLGYVSFDYSSETFWWPILKGLIARDIPVLLLMKYAPDDDTGHYRVIVGYDEEKGVVYFVDPWGRDLAKVTNLDGTVTWRMADFENAWNYTGYGTDRPYWGAVIIPWIVTTHTNGETTAGSVLEVTAEITYPCPQPFDCSSYFAFNTSAEIVLPPGAGLLGGSPKINIGYLHAGGAVSVTWYVKFHSDVSGSSISVKTTGHISGTVPEVVRKNEKDTNGEKNDKNKKDNDLYPAYEYTDEVGVEKSIEL